jgi:hypothetical protein
VNTRSHANGVGIDGELRIAARGRHVNDGFTQTVKEAERMRTLSLATLAELPAAVATPAYDPRSIGVGIVHLGIGAFHRAQTAVFSDDAYIPRLKKARPAYAVESSAAFARFCFWAINAKRSRCDWPRPRPGSYR